MRFHRTPGSTGTFAGRNRGPGAMRGVPRSGGDIPDSPPGCGRGVSPPSGAIPASGTGSERVKVASVAEGNPPRARVRGKLDAAVARANGTVFAASEGDSVRGSPCVEPARLKLYLTAPPSCGFAKPQLCPVTRVPGIGSASDLGNAYGNPRTRTKSGEAGQ
jgi:hypothetical protein